MKNTLFYFFTLCHLFFLPAYATKGSNSSSSPSSTSSLETSTDSTTYQRAIDQHVTDVFASKDSKKPLSRLGSPLPAPILPPIVPVSLSQLDDPSPAPILSPIVPVPSTRLSSRDEEPEILQGREMGVSLYSVSNSRESYDFGTEEPFQPPSYMSSYSSSHSCKSGFKRCWTRFKNCWKCHRRRPPQEEYDSDLP